MDRTTAPAVEDGAQQRNILSIVQSIAEDASTLVRKEIELARQEIVEALSARLKAAAALAAAGVMGFMGVVFLAASAAAALDNVMAQWLSRLVVAAAFLLLAGAAVGFSLLRSKRPPLAPAETARTVKEDVEWAKAQLRR